MDSVKLQTLNSKRLLLFIIIYVVAFVSFSLYASGSWMFFCCLLSYVIQVVCVLRITECHKTKLTSDNISSYVQSENNYKIIFVSLALITILLDTFPFIAMSGVGGLPVYEGGTLVIFMNSGIWCMWGYYIVTICGKNLQKEYDKRIASIEAQRVREERWRLEKERIETEFNSARQKLFNKYGECTIDICIGDIKEIKHHIYVFENSATIVLNGEEIAFNKILGFTLQDDSKTIMTSDVASYTSTTKTSTGSMLCRAVVGGMLTGGLGAVAGAVTAKKETITTPNQNQSKTTTSIKHNYMCYVNVNDLANPIREILLGEDSQKVQTVANILNVIITRNK